MYKEHLIFEKPIDVNTKIWRYLDFTKFVSLLDKQALFFARSDKLNDPFEGSISKVNLIERFLLSKNWSEKAKINWAKTQIDSSNFFKELRRFTIINSWHLNNFESAAMWKLYLKNDDGVAIQSTFNRLTKCFNGFTKYDIYIGKIKYIDYEMEMVPEGFTFYPFLYKRKSFEHEQELRALIQKYPIKNKKLDYSFDLFDRGEYIPVDLGNLIEKIYVSPTSPTWFKELVSSITNKFNLKKEVLQSILSEDPVY